MWQTSLFDEDFSARIVNVATVRKLSPFRYPGGKTWFVPYIRQWLSPAVRDRYHLTPIHPVHFIELFVGGGSISLTVASEHLVAYVTMVELDIDVSSAWQTVLNAVDGEWLAREILSYNLTIENVESLLNETPATVRRRAFQTIIKNRVNRGGILAPGAGHLKQGENGKRAGKRLYVCNELDHERLSSLASHIQGDFLMTYDDSDEVRSLAARYGLDIRLLPMSNTHHTKMSELLIGRNLDWVHILS